MATIDWPEWLQPRECDLTLVRNGLLFRSPTSGAVQTARQPGERWLLNLVFPPCKIKSPMQAQRRAFLNRLNMSGDRVRAYNFAQPVPFGSFRGAPTLFETADRGDSTLYVTGAKARNNLLSHSGFELDANSDGLCDEVSILTAGSFGTATPSRVTGAQNFGQRITASALGTADTDRAGVRLQQIDVEQWRGAQMTFAVACTTSGVACDLSVAIIWYDAADAFIVSDRTIATAPLAYNRRSVTATVPDTAKYARCAVYVSAAASVGSVDMTIDGAQFEFGSVATAWGGYPTLLAGDLIGAGGQLFEVSEDKTLNDAGAGVVKINNRVRASIASGSAVTWDRPKGLFINPSASQSASYSPGRQEPLALDLEEDWDA